MGRIGVPLMVALVVVADVLTIVHAGGLGAILNAQPQKAGGIALAALVGSGISKWMAGATISADITRFGRSASSVWTTTFAEFIVGNFGFNLLGLILGLGLRTSDLGAAFGIIGLTWLASIAFFVQSVTVETNELYAASLATANGAGLSRRTTNLIVAVLGVVIGFYGVSQGIIASFLTFIGYLGYALPVIPGIILADYYIVHRMNYSVALDRLPAVNTRAIVAFFVTIAINIVTGLMGDSFWHVLPLFGAVVYLLLSIPQTRAAWRTTTMSGEPAGATGGESFEVRVRGPHRHRGDDVPRPVRGHRPGRPARGRGRAAGFRLRLGQRPREHPGVRPSRVPRTAPVLRPLPLPGLRRGADDHPGARHGGDRDVVPQPRGRGQAGRHPRPAERRSVPAGPRHRGLPGRGGGHVARPAAAPGAARRRVLPGAHGALLGAAGRLQRRVHRLP